MKNSSGAKGNPKPITLLLALMKRYRGIVSGAENGALVALLTDRLGEFVHTSCTRYFF